jgi:glucose/arabinose dehydrogenase
VAALVAGCGDDAGGPVPTTTDRTVETKPEPDRGGGGGGGPIAIGDGRGGVELEQLGEFDQPVYVTQPAGERSHLYVVEQCGRVQRIPSAGGTASVFLDISDRVTCGGEQGLLSIAFAPDHRESGLLYAYYTDTEGDQRIAEYRRSREDPATAAPESERELLVMDDFAENHNGGLLLFGPDGELYAGTGDGGGAGDPERTAQDLESPLGKLLLIDTRKAGAAPAIAAYGLRNPWRFSFDRETGDLWIGDVGQDAVEEIDSVAAAKLDRELNFGWSAYEGSDRFNSDQQAPGALAPTLEYGREGGCSVTGGYVVRDSQLPTLYGRYLYGDFCEGQLRSFTAEAGRPAADDRPLGLEVPSLSSFGEDAAGRLYATSLQGAVYRLEPAPR